VRVKGASYRLSAHCARAHGFHLGRIKAMDLLSHLRQTILHNAWANQQVADALEPVTKPPAKAVLVLAHIVGAERLWHSRLVGNGSPEVWPALNVAQCAKAIRELSHVWTMWFGTLAVSDLDRTVSYVNSKGEPWSSTVREIITHMTHHSAYHRGQIATLIGSAGFTPAYTDFIHAVRQGLLVQ
jgi:uncharacterized damage-inducible protein DinB